ncbi:NifU family protein [Candidatus Pelagibacter sp.]|nr:NifU family protein [Candidatus Pelagibacter sp.]|tara:strand:- start:551 stop:1090 length:540 start_codon:yes stop_codon:yes gene_type:complete
MIVQTEITPNPNSLKFVPGKKVSLIGPIEITESDKTSNELVRNILTLKGVKSIFLSDDFISVNKEDGFVWEDLKHIIISFINEYFSKGHNCVINNSEEKNDLDTSTVEGQIIKILETKIRPAVARDGGDIKFKEFKDGIVRVELQGACSGCPSAAMTLKQGVQNLLCHYIPEVRGVEAI